MTLSAADLIARARRTIHEVSPVDVQARLPGSALIDVREPAEYLTGHLPGAVNIPRGLLEFEVATHPAVANVTDPALADRSRPIIVYCLSGGRAALATAALCEMGYSNVVSIQGGIRACIDAGLALTTKAA
jgi:rhodanese-related sulfurtransferase